jgi:hypothetical protein
MSYPMRGMGDGMRTAGDRTGVIIKVSSTKRKTVNSFNMLTRDE